MFKSLFTRFFLFGDKAVSSREGGGGGGRVLDLPTGNVAPTRKSITKIM